MKETTTVLPTCGASKHTKKESRAQAVIELFKKSQRLPAVSRLMKKKNSHLPPPDGMDLGSFYRL
jgi:hypothetical protein